MRLYTYKLTLSSLIFLVSIGTSISQKPYFPSDQRIFTLGSLSDLNAAYIALKDATEIGFTGSQDWSGFEGNPQTGLLFGNAQLGEGNSFAGGGFKTDKIAAFRRTQINAAYSYSAVLSDNNGFKPIRLLIGMQPHIDIFRAKFVETFEDIYPTAVPPEGLDQTTFGFNAGFILTNAGFEDQEENTWFAGASSRMSGLKLSDQTEGVTDIRHNEIVVLAGIRQNLNYEDLYLEGTTFVISSEAGVDLSILLNVEKYNEESDRGGAWFGAGFKSNLQSFIGAKQFILQAGLIRHLFEGEKKLIRIGAFMETDIGPFALLGNRYGLTLTYLN